MSAKSARLGQWKDDLPPTLLCLGGYLPTLLAAADVTRMLGDWQVRVCVGLG